VCPLSRLAPNARWRRLWRFSLLKEMPGPATLVGTHHAAPSHWPATPELTLVANAVDIAGHDECACCAGTRVVQNESGMSVNVEDFETTFSRGPSAQTTTNGRQQWPTTGSEALRRRLRWTRHSATLQRHTADTSRRNSHG